MDEILGLIQKGTGLVSAVYGHDQKCPGCLHSGMKQAGGINKLTKAGKWKCLCPTYPSNCPCRFGWK